MRLMLVGAARARCKNITCKHVTDYDRKMFQCLSGKKVTMYKCWVVNDGGDPCLDFLNGKKVTTFKY